MLFDLQFILISRLLIFFFFYYFGQKFIFLFPDINECLEETDNCNRKTQLCINTRGQYKCQSKIVDECLPGLKYNLGTKQCEGVY